MPLVGGGGAGNPTGQASGTGKGLAYMGGGVHAGWSGTIQIGSSAAAAAQFEFTSPGVNLIADYIFGIEGENIDTNSYYGFQISIDDQLVYEHTSRKAETMGSNVIGQPFNFVIPGFSKVKIEGRTTDTSGDTPCYGMLTCKEISDA